VTDGPLRDGVDDLALGELDLGALLAGMPDLPPIPDDVDPFEGVPADWRKLVGSALRHFELDQLPKWARPFAPVAMMTLAAKLAADPAGSRESLLELIGEAVCDMSITVDELGCWDAAGLPYLEPRPRARA
jgi:hypothetical protein